MRLLVVVSLFFVFSSGHLYSSDNGDCDSIQREALLRCANHNYGLHDKALNDVYQDLLGNIYGEYREDFVRTQAAWIRFKEAHCQNVYDEIYPGRESEIEKRLCLWKLTEDRVSELSRFYGGNDDDIFLMALLLLDRAGYDSSELVEKLNNAHQEEDHEWRNFKDMNCSLLNKMFEEPVDVCRSRLDFMRSY